MHTNPGALLEREIISSSPDALSFETHSQRVQDALRIIRTVSKQVGNTLPVTPMPEIAELDTTPGVYFVDNGEADVQVTGAKFEFVERNLSGAADSAHAAIPGDLLIEAADGTESKVTVVAKCFSKRDEDDRLVRIKHELTTMRAMQENDALTIDPIAVAMSNIDGEKQMILLTRYNPSLTTMDNLGWGRGLSDRGNVSNAILGAHALGQFNALGFEHRDAKVKNVAQDETGKVGMIDYETSVPFDLTNEFSVNSAAYTDFSVYLDCLSRKAFLDTRAKESLQQILGAYLSR
jgi:hypothetical protein